VEGGGGRVGRRKRWEVEGRWRESRESREKEEVGGRGKWR